MATSPPSCRRAPSSPGRRTRASSTISPSPSVSPSSTNATRWSARRSPNTTSAASAPSSRRPESRRSWSERMAENETPLEIFKRATAATVRALAEREDVTVSYGAEPPAAAGTRVRLPLPARDLSHAEAGPVRGAADAAALKLRYHDAALHARRLPSGETARAIFEGAEQARVEALGARRMSGVAANLAAMLDERYRRQGYEHLGDRNDVTLAEAVRLLAREALTGAPPPPAAQRVVAMWRPFLEGKVGRDLHELVRHVGNQDSYAKTVRQLIHDLDLDLGETEQESETDDAEGEGDDADQ